MKKTILFCCILPCLNLCYSQNKQLGLIDSYVQRVDNDSTLRQRTLTDTTFENGTVKWENVHVEIWYNQIGQVVKIHHSFFDQYQNEIVFYYKDGKAIKAFVVTKIHKTIDSPEYDCNSVVYYKNDKVLKQIDYKTPINPIWYLLTYNQFIKK